MFGSSRCRSKYGSVLSTFVAALVIMAGCGGPIPSGTDINDPNSMDDTNNQRPVAKAGEDISTVGGAKVTVDARESSDPDGDNLTFQWTFETDGEKPGISDPTDPEATIELPDVEIQTTYRLKLTVSDGSLSGEDELMIDVVPFVSPASVVLVADPGPDLNALAGTVVVLDGSQSIIGTTEETRIEWIQITGTRLTIEDGDKLIASFVAPDAAVETVFQIRLLLIHGTKTSSSTVTVVVQPIDFGAAGITPPTGSGSGSAPSPPVGGGGGGGGGSPAPPPPPPPVDNCPNDPNKLEPGLCGCGVVDDPTDTDNDGTADCIDGCPNDVGKTAPGVCGCGMADTDTDNDSTPDCNDGCPSDPAKIAPLFCGCGQPETDTDNDGSPDCVDGCPNDPNQTDAAQCGQPPSSASEQMDWDLYMLRLVNRARLDPAGEAARIGSSVTDNSTPVQPLAYAVLVGQAATNHNDWMHDSLGMIATSSSPDSFTHFESVDGTSSGDAATGTPGFTGKRISDRMNAVGFTWNNVGENILVRWGFSDLPVTQSMIEANHKGWWESTGHRNNMLNSNYAAFGHRAETRAITPPIGNLSGSVNFLHYATQNFARPSSGGRYAFGLLFTDRDANGSWTPRQHDDPLREGLADIAFEVFDTGTANSVATGETMDSGAFSVLLSDGAYDVVFTDASLTGGSFAINNVVVSGTNLDVGDHDALAP